MSTNLTLAVSELKEAEASALVDELLERGTDPMIILDQVRDAMEIIGKRYEQGIYFLPELIMSSTIMNGIKDKVKAGLAGEKKMAVRGRIVIGTVEGDIHNIGKDIVSFMLDSNGFEVVDLGVNVPARHFIDAVQEFKPRIVAMSTFLTLAYEVMKHSIEEFEKAGIRKGLKVMIGGGQIDERVRAYTGADGFGRTAMDAVRLAGVWTEEVAV